MQRTPGIALLSAFALLVLAALPARAARLGGRPGATTGHEPSLPAHAMPPGADDVVIPEGRRLALTRSTRVKPGEYLRPPLGEGARDGVILIEKAEGLTLDLTDVVLRGAPADTPLDRMAGWGIVVRDSKDVTIKGGKLSGYGGCIVVERSLGVVLDGIAFDGWYGMRLLSTIAAENEADWLWPHENDDGQWLARYGGAISLIESDDAVIKDCRGRHGQNGILMLRCERPQVFDNDFSFLSGWGLALYRTSRGVIARNVFDYCVRGYSHGVYWRGQDSAAILMFERCSDNVIAYNSATHSGDGIFLFAGRDSVEGRAFERGETEVGGSDRNLFYGNDFSYAVANGIEATFSTDNRCIANLIRGSHQHGIWGGYSRRMVVFRNTIEGTLGGAVSIEHGQDCLIAENSLDDNEIGVELWWDEDPDLVGGAFGKRFDTSSRDHLVWRNSFSGNDLDFAVTKTTGLRIGENVFAAGGRALRLVEVRAKDGAELAHETLLGWFTGIGGWSASGRVVESTLERYEHDEKRLPELLARERESTAPEAPGVRRAFDPDRKPQAGREGLDTIVMGEFGPWDFRSGEPRPAQRLPGGVLADARWEAAWFSWKAGPDPRGDAAALAAWRALAAKPLAQREVKSWFSPTAADAAIRERVGASHFGLIATTRAKLAAGRYRLAVVSDDGVRVSIDGRAVLENWTWHGPTRDSVDLELGEGEHEFRLEYFQIDGASALTLDLERLP